MYSEHISNIKPLGFTWETQDPFLFCVHHLDNYPAGNEDLGPAAPLEGRNLGQDFAVRDGWRMYHGDKVPGFPEHPHRGFETVTVVQKGFVDHSDSHGASGRYGEGDVQWMTAGSGMQHSEMFPLLNKDKPNPLELFQIWLNLPKEGKFAKPHYAMLWAEDIPVRIFKDNKGNSISIKLVAGDLFDVQAPEPAPDSWAHKSENQVGIWLVQMDAGAKWTIPTIEQGLNRTLYFYRGSRISVAGIDIESYHSADLMPDHPQMIENGIEEASILILQGRPIGQPVVQHGPFVMNSAEEIQQAFADYRTTRFGGWPWPRYDNVHPGDMGRFAKYSDGSEEIK